MGSRHGRETRKSNGETVASRPEIADARDVDAPRTAAPHAAATRRTLLFPTSELMRTLEPRAPERKLRSRSLFRSDEPEAKTLLRALGGYDSSKELVDDRSDSDRTNDLDVPSARPSELSTVPRLVSKGVAEHSSESMLELSASELQSERDLATSVRALRAPPLPRRVTLVDRDRDDGARAITDAPPAMGAADASRSSRRRTAIGLLVSHGMVAVVVALMAGSGRSPEGAHGKIVREPNIALSERTPLASPAASVTALPPPPAGGCAASGGARLLASRAQLGPGLEVSVLETGFGVALAAGSKEAVGLRVEGSGLRIAETVRVKAPSFVSHAVVDSQREDESDSFEVRVDSDEARTVISGEAPAFRIVARGGSIMALLDDLRGVHVRNIWALPGSYRAPAPAPAHVPTPAGKTNLYRPPGFSKIADPPRRPVAPAPVVSEVVRAVGRDDGGAVIALRRPSTLWLGVTDAALAPAGPLVSLTRKGATVGSPAVAPWGGGGAVAWAERAAGEREWTIVVAGFTPDGEGATVVGPVRVIGTGMSPTLAALPDGDLLLAYADGAAGAHRVVARRLGRELEPRGEALVVSPESINAGQPVAAVRPDGRAIVAFFAADRGSRAASVLATPLACDPGL